MSNEISALQAQLLREFIAEFRSDFFLSGGVALSWGYLHHRLSNDLDFFARTVVNLDAVESGWTRHLEQLGMQCETTERSETFRRFQIHGNGDTTLIDLVSGDPPGVAELELRDGIPIDSLLDIAVNKVLALNREEIKDYVDLFLILQGETFDIFELLERSKRKSADAESDWFPLEVADLLVHADALPNFGKLRLLISLDRTEMNARLEAEARKIFDRFRPGSS